MDNANGKDVGAPQASVDTPPFSRKSASERAIAPYHVHGSVLEGGDSPAVLAQPAAVHAEGQGSTFRPSPRAARAAHRARRALSDARDAVSVRYRRASDGTDDFVHDNPWKSIALAGIGGFLFGLLISRE
ncbi:YqjD family protein [Caballeronia sp. BR00000012568055]|uniref:DUF883 family protein n=1 Tax=Caballeronia sp. BR00000012568055 TaxID=2918761 RepID=UPI0023F7BF2D|nr:DUF883 domain-containing protein [Caballeronia sp. BR00000012568055]